MKKSLVTPALLLSLLGFGIAANSVHAADGDWKRGRVYYQMVCTACHTAKAGGAIAPNGKTMAEWKTYLDADKHAKGKESVKLYLSKQYRDSIKSSNKAAAKYADVAEPELAADIKAFVTKGAKDGDSPASCS